MAFIIDKRFDKHVQMCVDTSLGRFDDDVEWPAKWQKPGNDDCAKYFVRNYLSYKISVKDCKRIIKDYRYKLEYVQDLSLEKVKSCMLSRSQRYDDKLWVGIAECKDGFVGLGLAPIYNDSGYKCVDKIDAEDNCVKSHGNWNEKNDGTLTIDKINDMKRMLSETGGMDIPNFNNVSDFTNWLFSMYRDAKDRNLRTELRDLLHSLQPEQGYTYDPLSV